MMHAKGLGGLLVPLIAWTGGCGCIGAEDEATIGSAESSLIGDNALVPNALTPNALTPNALTPNALTPNALTPNALTPSALAAIQSPDAAGQISRELLRYTVGCALDASASFSFSWTDIQGAVHQEAYPGLLGIAPTWASGPLAPTAQQMVSACLAARTNFYSVPVTISMRSPQDPLRTRVKSDEIAAYPDIEGVFWGNLFTPAPYLHACYNEQTISNSRAYQRDCAVGHLDAQGGIQACGAINIVGRCKDHCKDLHPTGRYYKECADPALGKTELVITTALP